MAALVTGTLVGSYRTDMWVAPPSFWLRPPLRCKSTLSKAVTFLLKAYAPKLVDRWLFRTSARRRSPKSDKKSVRMQPARMMHTGAKACMLADVGSGEPDLYPILGSARPEVRKKGVVS